jgi:hypothetical protein
VKWKSARSSELIRAGQAAGLLLFGVGVDRWLCEFEQKISQSVYFEPSFNAALHMAWPALWVLTLFAIGLAAWSFSEHGSRRIGWDSIDSSGGLRWVAFSIGLTLFWSHGCYPYNLYFDQAHLFDRSMLLLLLFLGLRSPVLLLFFVVEVVISRSQLLHPIHSTTSIADELPIRILAMMAGAAVWNGVHALWATTRGRDRSRAAAADAFGARIPTTALIYAVLCLVGAYYSFAGYAKLEIGDSIFDWIRSARLENLFIAAHLNGWHASLSGPALFRIADHIASLSIFIAAATVVVELGMLFILAHRWFTAGIVAAVVSMHLGIVVMTGIFFWKWLLVDCALAFWLWLRRGDRSLARMYSPALCVLSIVLIFALNGLFGTNKFTWWNTRWESVTEVEGVGADGSVYRIDPHDFHPYMLLDFIDPEGAERKTIVYGMTIDQDFAESIQSARPRQLQSFVRRARDTSLDSDRPRDERAVADFMRRTFRSRNRRIAAAEESAAGGLGFLPSAPPLHMRWIEAPNLYREQSPIVEIRIRYRGRFYTGKELVVLDDEVIQRVMIADDREPS